MTITVPEKLKPFMRVEVILLLILILTIVLRFMFLDLKLFHHDEAIHAYLSYKLLTTGEYLYDPTYHGPFLYYVTSAMFSIFGASDIVGRILPCIFGCALIPLIYWIYRMHFINGKVACIASLFVAISPCMLYFTRFLRNDIFVLFFTVLLIAAMLAWMTKQKWYWLCLAAVAAALGLCCKENMPIILVIFGAYFLYLLWTKKFMLPNNWWVHLLAALAVFTVIVFSLYSSLWQHPEMIPQAGGLAIEHWFGIQKEQRIGGPAVYYLGILVLYEISLFALAVWGGIRYFHPPKAERTPDSGFANLFVRPIEPRTINREHEFILFAIVWAVTAMITYAVIGEKVPWLILHQLFPIILVAAFGLSVLKPKRVFFIGAAAIIYLCIVSGCTVYNPCDICGPIVQVQNSEEIRPVIEDISHAEKFSIMSSEAVWPYMWYNRDNWNNLNYYLNPLPIDSTLAKDYDIILIHDEDSYDELPGYEKVTIPNSYWFDAAATGGYGFFSTIGNWLKYYFTRLGSKGSLNICVFRKTEPGTASPNLSEFS